MKVKHILMFAFVIFSGLTLHAQSSSVLTGFVYDATTRQPIADAMVTAVHESGPNEVVIMTDSKGSYRIPQLPMGHYKVRIEAEGYKPFNRDSLMLRLRSTVRLNVDLLPSSEVNKED